MTVDEQHLPDVREARAWLRAAARRLNELAHAEDGRAELGDLAATIEDVAIRAPLPLKTTNTVTLDESAIAAYQEAQVLLTRAGIWATGADIAIEDDGDFAAAEREVLDRVTRFAEMERSLHTSLLRTMFVGQHHDGPITLSRDSEACWYWRHPRSGYHGGIIFHPSYTDGERLPVGTWSVHT